MSNICTKLSKKEKYLEAYLKSNDNLLRKRLKSEKFKIIDET